MPNNQKNKWFAGSRTGTLYVPRELMTDKRLNFRMLKVLLVLWSRCDGETGKFKSSPGLRTFEELSGVTCSHLAGDKGVMAELERLGWIELIQGKNGRTNQYRMRIPMIPQGDLRVETNKQLPDEIWAAEVAARHLRIATKKAKNSGVPLDDIFIPGITHSSQVPGDNTKYDTSALAREAANDYNQFLREMNDGTGPVEEDREVPITALGGVVDMHEIYEQEESAGTSQFFHGLTKEQVLEIGYGPQGPDEIDDATLHYFGISRNAFG